MLTSCIHHQGRIQNQVEHPGWSFFAKIVNDQKPLFLDESSIVDVRLDSKYASDHVCTTEW